MQLTTGTVVNGKVVVEGAVLREGAVVTLLTRGADESFSLSPEQEGELLESLAEIDRGESVGLNELLSTLPRRS